MSGKRIAYITFWGINEGITRATVFPTLSILDDRKDVNSVTLYTFERHEKTFDRQAVEGFSSKVRHRPVKLHSSRNTVIRAFDSLAVFWSLFKQIHKRETDLVVCRCSTAGLFGVIVAMLRGLPLVIESFEPHADYMADAHTWSRFGMKYITQKMAEKVQVRYALALMTVTGNYKNYLESKGRRHMLFVAPCPVDTNKFRFSAEEREKRRRELGFGQQDVVGIYTGKFNDIYFSLDEAFYLFKKFRERWSTFKLVILTEHSAGEVYKTAAGWGFPGNEVIARSVPHDEVGSYLSAADVGFALIRPSDNRKYCCPIKTGEYWAVELPVVIPRGVGDDSAIIQNSGAGVVLSEHWEFNPADIEKLLGRRRNPVSYELAKKHRSADRTREAYEAILGGRERFK